MSLDVWSIAQAYLQYNYTFYHTMILCYAPLNLYGGSTDILYFIIEIQKQEVIL